MSQLLQSLSSKLMGKKTYISMILLGIVGYAASENMISMEIAKPLCAILSVSAGVCLRAGVEKSGPVK